MQFLLWASLLAGHIGICCAIFNRTHATAWPRPWRKLIERGIILVTGLPLLLVPVWVVKCGHWTVSEFVYHSPAIATYVCLCVFAFCFFLMRWFYRQFNQNHPDSIRHLKSERFFPEMLLGATLTKGWMPSVLRLIPGNQVVQLVVEKYEIRLGKANPPADQHTAELRILQLTDLHFTGQVKREYFEFAVEKANEFQPDLVFITGDIVDKSECLDWIEPLFSKLRSKHGSYYVLGNHDRRIRDEQMLRTRLERAGLIQASGIWHELNIRGTKLEISGNDLPWYRGAAQLPLRKKDPNSVTSRILLSHSPDQIDWAVRYGFDLVFAGHTHGGQIRLPLIGPIIAPSRYGVRYASGDFFRESTLMHVSRGISGDDPIRLLCPPELGLFILKVPATNDSSDT